MLLAILISTTLAHAANTQTTVKTLGGAFAGYVDGNTYTTALFNSPAGLALDYSGRYLFVADKTNSRVRVLDLSTNLTFTFTVPTNLLGKPIAVAVNGATDVTVLNRFNNTNGSVITFNVFAQPIFTNALRLTNATGMAVDALGNIFVTVQSNTIIRIDARTTNRTTIASITNAGVTLAGLTVRRSGTLVVCDAGRNGLYEINPTNGLVLTNSGFNGLGDFLTNGINVASNALVKYRQPMNVAETGDGVLLVTDNGNNRVKVILTNGVVTNLYGVSSTYWSGLVPGGVDGTVKLPDSVGTNVQSRLPLGVVVGWNGRVYTTEQYYHIIRQTTNAGFVPPLRAAPTVPLNLVANTNATKIFLNWTNALGATSYNVKRAFVTGGPYTQISSTVTNSFTDTNVINGLAYFYVVSASNLGGEGVDSAEASAIMPLLPVANPVIGYVDFPLAATGSVFHATSFAVFSNDVLFVINGVPGSQNYFNFGPTSTNSPVPNPTNSSALAPAGYTNGLANSVATNFAIAQALPDLTIKAISTKTDGSPPSSVVAAQFQFITANPVINGNNAAQFTLSDLTVGAHLYYTLDGSAPSATNAAAVDLGTVPSPTNVWPVSFSIISNTIFKVRAFRDNYQPSAIVTNPFALANFNANRITFGFPSQEASSAFLASPGQTFYAPVTLSLLPNATMNSLRFSLAVTNNGTNPAPAMPPGAFDFKSRLVKPDANSAAPSIISYLEIPPYMFADYAPAATNLVTYNGTNFINLKTTNADLNQLSIGWLERAGGGATNLYNTTAQDLITYSLAQGTLFNKSSGKVIAGDFLFQVPTNAVSGQTYQIQITTPVATSDGFETNQSSVMLLTSTNSVKSVAITNTLKYLVGSVSPFRWWNAGDFGTTNLGANDVSQVFRATAYRSTSPFVQAPASDFADAMDAAGNLGALCNDPADANFNIFTNSFSGRLAADPLLASTNADDINQVVFGNGVLDVTDVFVTYRRSQDTNLVGVRRFWNNGQRVANLVTNGSFTAPSNSFPSNPPALVTFIAGDAIGSVTQAVQIPISATILGNYQLRVLLFNVTLVPLDGSPAITNAITFTQNTNAPLDSAYANATSGNGNYSSVWLSATNAGLTGTAVIGTLNVTLPADAGSNAAYAVHFDHASGSPNGLAIFPGRTLTGVFTATSRTNSSYADGIPDVWRLRWFGTTNNLLSAASANPSGDGVDNFKKYVAGLDPYVANNFPALNQQTPLPAGYAAAIHWPSVAGKQYIVERSFTLFEGNWTSISTNTGTGGELEFDDDNTDDVKFYRVRILP